MQLLDSKLLDSKLLAHLLAQLLAHLQMQLSAHLLTSLLSIAAASCAATSNRLLEQLICQIVRYQVVA